MAQKYIKVKDLGIPIDRTRHKARIEPAEHDIPGPVKIIIVPVPIVTGFIDNVREDDLRLVIIRHEVDHYFRECSAAS